MDSKREDRLSSHAPSDDPRVALVSIGIGRVQRGFERMFTELFGVLQGQLDVTLFKSAGTQTPKEKVPTLLWPTTHLLRKLPLRPWLGTAEYNRDSAAFAATFLPNLLANRYDVVHYIDPPLAKLFAHLRRAFHFRPRLLFTDGCVAPLSYYQLADHIHQPSAVHFQHAVDGGVPASHITMIPSGLHSGPFMAAMDKKELRRKHGVPENAFVVLAVSAVKRVHKRVDYIIDEVAQLSNDCLLWIDGNPEDESVCELARQKLGARCKITYVPSRAVPELFQLADVAVHAALEESFGSVIVEALFSRAMVLAHDSPHFEWLIQDRECLVDMSTPGNLARRLCQLKNDRGHDASRAQARADNARRRFDWQFVARDYIEMYRKEYRRAAQGKSAAA